MIINADLITGIAKAVSVHFDLEVDLNNTFFTVHSDSDKGINEFEARLVAAVALEDGLEDVAEESLPVYLDLYTNIIDTRTSFHGRQDHWTATYQITPGEETNLYGG